MTEELIHRICYDNGQTREFYTTVNGIKHGDSIVYDKNGDILYKCVFYNDTLKSMKSYFKGDKHGKHVDHYENGQMEHEHHYFKGKKHGEQVDYYENGNIEVKVNYHHGKRHGEDIGYYENGNVRHIFFFVDGEECGECTEYYENGSINVKCHYVGGKRHGGCVYYYEHNGGVEVKCHYVDGKRQGESIDYYDNGNVESRCNYVDDKKQGERIDYYENGNMESKYNYVDDVISGEWINYDENGEIVEVNTVVVRVENKEEKHVKLCKGLLNDKEDMDCVICGDEKSCYTFFKCNHKCCFDCFIQMNKYQCYYNCDQDENESLYESDFETASEQEDNDDIEESDQEETGKSHTSVQPSASGTVLHLSSRRELEQEEIEQEDKFIRVRYNIEHDFVGDIVGIYTSEESAMRKIDEYKQDGYDVHCVKGCLDMSHGLN